MLRMEAYSGSVPTGPSAAMAWSSSLTNLQKRHHQRKGDGVSPEQVLRSRCLRRGSDRSDDIMLM